MFIEKISKEEIIAFSKDFLKKFQEENPHIYFELNQIFRYKKNKGVVTFALSGVAFTVSDFDFKNDYLTNCNRFGVDKAWLKFMYDKFGEEYKKAFFKNREKQRQLVIKETANKFDLSTAEYKATLEK